VAYGRLTRHSVSRQRLTYESKPHGPVPWYRVSTFAGDWPYDPRRVDLITVDSSEKKGSTKIDRVDVDRVMAAPKEDSGERRSAEAIVRRDIEIKTRKRVEDQKELQKLLAQKEAEWALERTGLQKELNEATEENMTLDRRVKRGSLTNTVITAIIAGVTAIGSVGTWSYNKLHASAEAHVLEEQERIRVTKELVTVSEDLDEYKREQAIVNAKQVEVNEEQGRVNTVQLLRGQRLETLMELMLAKQGSRPPGKSEEQKEAECEAGLLPREECQ